LPQQQGLSLVCTIFSKPEKRQEEMDWAMYVEHIRKQKNNPAPIVIMPKLGSEEHKWAERMVAKGFLERNPLLLGYCLKHANCS